MLRKIRIILAALFFTGITLMFLDFTGMAHKWLGWMARIQFLPAVLAVNTVTVAGLLLLTVLSGRVYCSVICPLGILQDIISWANGRRRKKLRFRFGYKKDRKWVRRGFLAAFIIALALGAHSAAILIAPYSAYGRIASSLFAPIYALCNNLLAWIAGRVGSYAFYSTEVWIKSLPTFIVAGGTLIILFIMAWRGGREYCNTVCPVGTILGFFSKRSIFAPVIDTDKCRNCGLCGKQCRSSCIDMKNHEIDYTRCVVCMDCIDSCSEGAISFRCRYTRPDKAVTDTGRRTFIATAAFLTGSAAEAGSKGILKASNPENAEREVSPVPAGAGSIRNFHDRCTGCQLCVSACPEHVLRPSSSLGTLMQPEMCFDKGYCHPECNRCSELCPAGAIIKVSTEEKSSVQIGHAVVNHENCVVNTDRVQCLSCARNCPAGAIRLVRKDPADESSLMIPAVNEERCIGCGACEHYCPAKPVKAIHIEGHHVHKTI